MSETPTDYERLGGEPGLRDIVTAFIDRVYDDVIIGFFFWSVDRAQLIEREIEHAAAHLGGPKAYRGKSIPEAHAKHPINRGHFHRRLHLLEQTLRQHNAPEDVIERWLEQNRRLESAVTDRTDCAPSKP